MKLSWDWLNDFADFRKVGLQKVLEKINSSICEIDGVEEFKPQLKTIIAARLDSVSKHPNADKLFVCEANDGKSKIQIVTGAQNVKVGDIVPLALPGTIIFGKEIQPSALKNIQSFGMFCSEKELGFAEESSGVLILDKSTKLGISMAELYELEDTILTVDNKSITHRPDLWSHFGFARELASQLNLPLYNNPFDSTFEFTLGETVNVKKNSNAHSYFACIIKNIQIVPSGNKIKSRLEKCGAKSINNIVDVSNYVLFETGQPTHFFDNLTLVKSEIEVCYSKEGEKIKLLDGSDRDLEKDILVIKNGEAPVAIAGVMGGLHTSVSEKTKELLLESAIFKREDIRHSTKKLNIRSEAAMRYEKGLDSFTPVPILKRALVLLKENGCSSLEASKPIGFNNRENTITEIETSFDFIEKKLGIKLEDDRVLSILSNLGFKCEKTQAGFFKVLVPFYRQNYDVTIPEDLVEEIGRSIGYANIEKLPLNTEVRPVHRNFSRETERRIKTALSEGFCFNEVFNYSFAGESDTKLEENFHERIEIQNSMPSESQFMRTSIYPSLLKNLAQNQDRFETAKIFEFGRTYHQSEKMKEIIEKKFFGLASMLNLKSSENLVSLIEKEFLTFRNIFETIFLKLNLANYQMKICSKSYFHPNSSIEFQFGELVIGEVGILHPRWKDSYDLQKTIFMGKIYFDNILVATESVRTKFNFQAPSNFPQDKLDISMIMENSSSTIDFANAVKKANIPEVESIWVHDIFTGGSLKETEKSVTYRVSLLSYDKTFTNERINQIQETLIKLVTANGYKMK